MIELHGVLSLPPEELPSLKRHALLFDKFHLSPLSSPKASTALNIRADIAYLQERGFLDFVSHDAILAAGFSDSEKAAMVAWTVEFNRSSRELYESSKMLGDKIGPPHPSIDPSPMDWDVRRLSVVIGKSLNVETVPIWCTTENLDFAKRRRSNTGRDVLRVGLQSLPVPDERCSWEDILNFKAELFDKQWAFRRWLRSLATKHLTEAEIKDELQWLLNEYETTMKVHQIKTTQTFVDVFVISPLEIIENLVKFNWSKIARGMLSVQKRKLELLEAEMKAPGKECAYVFDARKRFGT